MHVVSDSDYDFCLIDGINVDIDDVIDSLDDFLLDEIIEALEDYSNGFTDKVIKHAKMRQTFES